MCARADSRVWEETHPDELGVPAGEAGGCGRGGRMAGGRVEGYTFTFYTLNCLSFKM